VLRAAAALALLGSLPVSAQEAGPAKSRISTNQAMVEGLAATIDVKDPVAVFAHVFAQLPDSVTVYPTENYYYWSFFANGRPYWGNFRLDVRDRDKGIVHIGYFEYDENAKFQDYEGGDKALSEQDGVSVQKLERFSYAIAYKGKTVTFRLNDAGMAPPKRAKLRPEEIFVGPVFDESGVRLYLIFNNTENRFHYLLNEEVPAAESHAQRNEHVTIGRRTGYAYYVDKDQDRKVLIGVYGPNARRNNYYDGPFDQLPDNYADETRIRELLERAYPQVKGKINQFGQFIDDEGVRVTPWAYYTYSSEEELDFVSVCLRARLPKPKFYACITPDPQKEQQPMFLKLRGQKSDTKRQR
jgi:hypothetical protein